jgi:hypothetical protein
MSHKELKEELFAAEMKRRPLIFKILGQEPEIYEIRKRKGMPLPPGETKVWTDTALSRLLGGLAVWVCLIIWPFIGWKIEFLGFVGLLLLLSGIKSVLSSAFGRHRIEISDKGLRVEQDFFNWTQIKTVFFVIRPGKGETHRMVVVFNDETFKMYPLSYYSQYSDPVVEGLEQYLPSYISK